MISIEMYCLYLIFNLFWYNTCVNVSNITTQITEAPAHAMHKTHIRKESNIHLLRLCLDLIQKTLRKPLKNRM